MVAALAPDGVGRAGDALLSIAGLSKPFGGPQAPARSPIAALHVLAIGVVLWAAAEDLPVGRRLHAIDANRRAAAIDGIPARRHLDGAVVVSGLLGAIAGASQRRRRLRPAPGEPTGIGRA